MSNLNKSMPKMRQTFTPRVKSAQMIHESQPKKALFFTNQKNNHKNVINPQNINQQLQKKLNLNLQKFPPNKKQEVSLLHTDIGSPIKRNDMIHKNPVQQKNLPTKKLQNKPRLQRWDQDNRFHKLNNYANQQPLKIDPDLRAKYQNQKNLNKKQQIVNKSLQINNSNRSRCMSAHTLKTNKSAIFSQKSNKIKQQKKQFDDKFNVAFNYLLRSNSQYLKQKLSMCNQKSRPKQEILKIKRPSINTTNVDFYKKVVDKHKLNIQPQNQKMSILLSNQKVCGNSMNHEAHSGRQGKKADIAQWSQGFKLQGPIYSVTTKQSAYPDHGDFNKMVPIAVWNQHPLGMKHKQLSNNSKFYKGQFRPRAELAIWNNLNPIANDLFNPQNNSLYSKQFQKKQIQPIQQWPMPQHKLITTNINYNTQLRDNLIDYNSHELNFQNKCKCGRKRH